MNSTSLYKDIVERTNGDIYLGVVGPVRVGKSTFISKFMQSLVLPNIQNENEKKRTIDELPQSADGKTIMTTQVKFVPNQSVHVKLSNNVNANIRLIDCVGYLVDGALGAEENDKPRLVKTPWSKEEMPLVKAAELGTKKVIAEHSTIAVALTTDGSFGDLPREAFLSSEEKVINELKKSQKPFVVVLNTKQPNSEITLSMVEELKEKYNASVLALDVEKLSLDDINEIFTKMLKEFPLSAIDVKMPLWMQSLPFENPLIQEIVNEIKTKSELLQKIGQFDDENLFFAQSSKFEKMTPDVIKMGEGKIEYDLRPLPNLFYEVLSEQCGMTIQDDFQLISYIKELGKAKVEYDKLKEALTEVEENGYGVVNPTFNDMQLDDPVIVKQGNKFGVKIKANAPSLHIMKVDLETELTPLVGSQEQAEDFVKYLQSEFEGDAGQIWKANVFGKTLDELINDGMKTKINGMPVEAQKKMRKTLTKIVNEGKGGIICILL